MGHHPLRFGVVAAFARSGEEWLAKARRVEELGYRTLLMPDRLGPLLSPLPALAAAATATRTLRIGTFVIANGLRNPVVLAHECATLDFLSGGRFELGLGAGVSDEDFRTAGIPFESPGARVDQLARTIGVVKAHFGGKDGGAPAAPSTLPGAPRSLQPIQKPWPPILVAGAGPRMLALAAKEADIVGLGLRPPAGEAELKEKVGLLRREAGDRFDHLELSINLVAVAGDAPLAPSVRQRLQGMWRTTLEELIQAQSPFVVHGTTDQMCEQVLGLRKRFGISYVMAAEDLMDAFAPVVARLAGQ